MRLLHCIPLVLSFLAMSCDSAQFTGQSRGPTKAQGDTGLSPNEDDASGRTPETPGTKPGGGDTSGQTPTTGGTTPLPDLPKTPDVCANNHRALRIAVVVDNTGSNGCWQTVNGKREFLGGAQSPTSSLCGTDPRRTGSPRSIGGTDNTFTDRQVAVYDIVERLSQLDKAAAAKDPSFLGSEVGLVSFPQSFTEYHAPQYFSLTGMSAAPVMTNTKNLNFSDGAKTSLWNMLNFTHRPDGITIFKAALDGAHALLRSTEKPSDPRPKVVIFITDGMPTDSKLSAARAARATLGADTRVILFTFYESKATLEGEARATLENLWSKPDLYNSWGREDGYTSFDDYMRAVMALPGQISNERRDIQGSGRLGEQINSVLGTLQNCAAK